MLSSNVLRLIAVSTQLWLPVPATNLAASATPADSPGAKPTSNITVRVAGLRNNRGTVYVALFDNKKSFDDSKGAVQSGQARPKQGTAIVVLKNVVPGRYALSFIHDENDNKKLDTNLIGIPKEGFGYSKDAMGRFGPPKFDDAALVIPAGDTTIVMHAKHM